MSSSRQSTSCGKQQPSSSSGSQKPTTSANAAPGSSKMQNKKPKKSKLIPEDILDDVTFRFINNLPDDEIDDHIRFCFQLEQAHWYYVDFYCGGESDISLREFSKQVCMRSEGRRFSKHGRKIDSIIDSFHDYKRSVPVNGAVLLDSTLTYVLLVQGMSATQDSWGFPKGKVNENEDPLDCAAREVLEEVGYDCTGKIHPRKCSQKFVKKTCIRLYFVKDVPIEFDFKPRVRNEIRKIQWFKLSELPNDYSSFADVRKGPEKRNFYVVFPFVDDIQAYVKNELKQINTSHRIPRSHLRSGGESSRSAFKPVSPSRRQSQCGAIEAALHPRNSPKGTPPKPQSAQTFVELLAAVNKKSANQFIPVKETSPPRFESAAEDKDLLASDEPGPSSQGATSIKLDSFMQMFSKANQENKVPTDLLVSCDVLESQIGATSPEQSETTTKKALAAIGSESADKRKKKERQSEIKQPKARRYPVNEPVYEAEGDPTDAGGEATGENEPEETPTNSGVEFDDADFYYTPVSERRPTPGPNAVAEEHEDKTPKKKPRKPRRKKNSSGSKPEETEGPAQLEEPKHRDSIYEQGIAIDLHSLLNSAGTYGGTCSRSALSEQQISHEANRCRSETDSASISTSAEVRVVPCESWKRPVKIDVADLFAMFS